MGARLVERDRRFVGLTAEGAAVLPWARQTVAAYLNLAAAASSVNGPLKGDVRIGSIPAAMPLIGHLAHRLQTDHPGLVLSFHSMTSETIIRRVRAFELDAGLTYVDHDLPPDMRSVSLYRDRFIFLAAAGSMSPPVGPMALATALDQRLCLLPETMQNRRILDEQLLLHGMVARPVATADSFDTLMAMASTGHYSTFLPESYRSLIPASMVAVSTDPSLPASRIGLILPNRNLPSTTVEAVSTAAKRLILPPQFDPT